MGTGQGTWKDMSTMTGQTNPPELVDRLRHFERNQIESGDEYGAEVLHRAAEEIARLTRERDEARAEVERIRAALAKARGGGGE